MTKNIQTIKLVSRGDVRPELKRKKINISEWADDILEKVEWTNGIEYEIAILKASDCPSGYPTTSEIRKKAEELGYATPPAEVAALILLKVSDEQMEKMGLWWIITMHEPITDSDGDPRLLDANRDVDGRWLDACYGGPDDRWRREGGFAFVVPQVSAKKSDAETSVGYVLCPSCGHQLELREVKEGVK